MRYKIIRVKEIPQGYIGMNYYAARTHKIPFPYSRNVILVKEGLTEAQRRQTIQHERVEINLMRRGRRYRTAHKEALKRER